MHTYLYIWITLYLKLTQYCKSTILKKIYFKTQCCPGADRSPYCDQVWLDLFLMHVFFKMGPLQRLVCTFSFLKSSLALKLWVCLCLPLATGGMHPCPPEGQLLSSSESRRKTDFVVDQIMPPTDIQILISEPVNVTGQRGLCKYDLVKHLEMGRLSWIIWETESQMRW